MKPNAPSGLRARAALVLAGFLFLSGCQPRSDIVVGFAASVSGKDYTLGVEGRNAATLFVDRLNAAGGIGGRRLRLAVVDLASDDSRAEEVSRTFLDQGVAAVVGYYSSSSALAAVPWFADTGVALISPAATSSALSGKDDGFFRTIMSSERDPLALAAIMKEAGHGRVLFIAAGYNKPYYETYRAGLEGRVAVSGELYYDRLEQIDYGRIARVAAEPGYDAVMVVASSLDTGTIAQQLSVRGLLKPLYLSGWAANDDVITYGGPAVEGAVAPHQVNLALTEGLELSAAYREAYGAEPGYAAVETWDSFYFLEAGIEAARGDPKKLMDALRNIDSFEGTSGVIAMDPFGDARRPLYLKKIVGGRFVVTGMQD